MKTFILAIIAILGISAAAAAQTPETLSLKVGQHKTAKKSTLKIKFVSVVEDSRCPKGVQCVWAGNARVKIEVTSRRLGRKTFELNTGMGPTGDQFDGWAINLESLLPYPNAAAAITPKAYRAKFTIVRLQR